MSAPPAPPPPPAPEPGGLDGMLATVRRVAAELYPRRPLLSVVLVFQDAQMNLLVPEAPAGPGGMRLSADGLTLLHSNGRRYALTTNQAPAVALLVRAYQDGTRDVSAAALLEAGGDTDCSRVRDLFRRSELWADGLIGQSSRGVFRLLDEDEVE